MYIDNTLNEYIDSLGSEKHIPGGGSAAGLVASLGNALISMVYNLSIDKKSFKDLDEVIRMDMENKYEVIRKSIEICKKIVDEDTLSFNGVMEAYSLPKSTEDELILRRIKIEEGYRMALRTPYELSKLINRVFESLEIFAKYGNLGAITDIGIGVLFLYASLESSLLNMRINLNNISDEDYKDEMNEYIGVTLEKGKVSRDKLMNIIYDRLK